MLAQASAPAREVSRRGFFVPAELTSKCCVRVPAARSNWHLPVAFPAKRDTHAGERFAAHFDADSWRQRWGRIRLQTDVFVYAIGAMVRVVPRTRQRGRGGLCEEERRGRRDLRCGERGPLSVVVLVGAFCVTAITSAMSATPHCRT